MLVEEAVVILVTGNAGVLAAIGSRFYREKAPTPTETTYPYAVYHRVDSVPISGIWQDTDWARTRIQVDVYGTTGLQARTASEAVIGAINRYHGTVTNAGHETVTFDDILLESERDIFESQPILEGVSRVTLDFMIIHRKGS